MANLLRRNRARIVVGGIVGASILGYYAAPESVSNLVRKEVFARVFPDERKNFIRNYLDDIPFLSSFMPSPSINKQIDETVPMNDSKKDIATKVLTPKKDITAKVSTSSRPDSYLLQSDSKDKEQTKTNENSLPLLKERKFSVHSGSKEDKLSDFTLRLQDLLVRLREKYDDTFSALKFHQFYSKDLDSSEARIREARNATEKVIETLKATILKGRLDPDLTNIPLLDNAQATADKMTREISVDKIEILTNAMRDRVITGKSSTNVGFQSFGETSTDIPPSYEPPKDLDVFLHHTNALPYTQMGIGIDDDMFMPETIAKESSRKLDGVNEKEWDDVQVAQANEAINGLFSELEKHRQKEQHDIELEKRVIEERREWDLQLHKYLQKLIEEHNERINSIVRTQRKLFDIESAQRVEDALSNERARHLTELEKLFAKIDGIENVLTGRAARDFEYRRAKLYWAACQNLSNAVIHGNLSGQTAETRKKPLLELDFVSEIVGPNDKFVQRLVNSFAEDARHNGVYTEQDLKGRFTKVYPLVRKLAKLDPEAGTSGGSNNGVSPLRIILSYFQHLLTFDSPTNSLKASSTDKLGGFKQNQYEILRRIRQFVAAGDFDSAVRIGLLLQGEPARLLADWIADVRRHLEARLLSDLIVTHARGSSIRSVD